MAYIPINTQAYVSAYAGAIAGMAISGWIVNASSGHYAQVSAIAGAFSEAFDQAWNNAGNLNNLEIRAIQSVCQNEFAGRGPGSFDNPNFVLRANWAVPAAACAALVLEGGIYFASQGINPGIPDQSFLIRQSLVDLIALDNANIPNGAHAFIVDEGETYVLDTANAFTAFSDLILARTVGTGRWFRRSKAFVVGNYTLWITNFISQLAGGNKLLGFTPGQLVASNSNAPEIVIDLNPSPSPGPQLENPIQLACDAYGNVWLMMIAGGGTPWRVLKFELSDILQSGTVAPRTTLQNALSAGLPQAIDHCTGIAFDKDNNLWIAGRNTATSRGIVQKIPSSVTSREGSFLVVPPVSLQCGAGVWFDLEKSICFDGSGNLWLSGYQFPSVSKVPLAQQLVTDLALVPSVRWSGANFSGPEGIAHGPTGLLWMADYNTNSIKAFDPQEVTGNPAPLITITSASITGPYNVTFDGDGNMWVLNYNNWDLLKFAAADILVTGAPVPTVILNYPGLAVSGPFAAGFCFPNDPNRSGLLPSGTTTKKGQV